MKYGKKNWCFETPNTSSSVFPRNIPRKFRRIFYYPSEFPRNIFILPGKYFAKIEIRIPTDNIRRTLGFITTSRFFFPISLFFLCATPLFSPAISPWNPTISPAISPFSYTNHVRTLSHSLRFYLLGFCVVLIDFC